MRLLWILACVWSLPVMGGTAGYLALVGPPPLRYEQSAPPWVLTVLPPLDMGNKPELNEAELAARAHADGKTNALTAASPAAAPPGRSAEETTPAPATPATNAPTAVTVGASSPTPPITLTVDPSPPPQVQTALPAPGQPLLVPQMLLQYFQPLPGATNRTGTLLNLPFIPPAPAETKSSTATYEKK